MSRSVAVIQARMTSSRLPGKVLADLAGKPVLAWICRAAAAVPGIHDVVVATSADASDDPVAAWCVQSGVRCVRGPLDDVLHRFAMAAEATGADSVLRLTGDCPFLDPWLAGLVLAVRTQSGCDFATNADIGTWPDGLDAEAISVAALRAADAEATRKAEREHVTPFVTAQRSRFDVRSVPCPIEGLQDHRWTLDTPEDLDYLKAIAAHLPADRAPHLMEILAVLERNPQIRRTAAPQRNAAYGGVRPERNAPDPVFEQSHRLYARALRTIPTASQTFSKSALQFPKGRAPLFLSHGRGGHVWDADGNEYVDMVCALLSVSIGYCDPAIDAAVRRQLARGISYSLPSLLECELAEKIVETVPCAEAVRFGKNGSDATSAAIRIARAYTGRARVLACGYHGWQDWYIGATSRDKGVPAAVRGLTQMVPYNDLGALEAAFDAHPGEIAALIMEPVTFDPPASGYLEAVRALTRKHGSVLVFDEVVTGFRLALGGAQEMLGVTPDLACIGKGLGNGLPLAAIAGRKELMREMEDIFYSGTFGGEALSLAAGNAVIDLMRREPVIATLWERGQAIADGIAKRIEAEKLHDTVVLKGYAPWTLLAFRDARGQRKEAIRTLFVREMIAVGVLTLGSNNVCYRHGEADVAWTLDAYDRALGTVARELATGALEDRLGHPAIEPIFQVRKA